MSSEISGLESLEGKYEIVAKLREGGMGAVYKVRHRLLDEVRAVKVLHAEHGNDDELKERFWREARSAIQLRHPHVVQIFDFSLDPSGLGLLVMEYIQGADWRRLIRGGRRPSLALGLEIARQALLALGYLHRGGFVHRDVSPDNLMLALDHDRRPLVKLIDLGIAKRLGAKELTVAGSFLGKFRYASPEHFAAGGSGGLGPSSDLYTFGLVLYELLTGHYAMEADDTSQLISAHLFNPPRPFGESDPEQKIDSRVRAMLLRAMAKRPKDRYSSAQSWVAEIEALQELWPYDERAVMEARHWLGAAAEDPGPSWDPGSTQSKLDRNFGLERTPRPFAEDETRTLLDESSGLSTGEDSPSPEAVPCLRLVKAVSGELTAASEKRKSPPAQGADGDPGEDGDDFEALFETGVKAVLLRDYARAFDLFEAARRLRPDEARVAYNLDRLRARMPP